MTEAADAVLILAALNAALTPAVAYEYDKVPGSNGNDGTEPAKYAVIDLSRRYTEKRRGDGSVSVVGGRLGVRYIADSVANARSMRALGTAAIEDKILGSGAGEIGPFCFESAEPIRPDEGYQVALDVFTF